MPIMTLRALLSLILKPLDLPVNNNVNYRLSKADILNFWETDYPTNVEDINGKVLGKTEELSTYSIYGLIRNGANLVVIGNKIEQDVDFLLDLTSYQK